MVFLGLTDKRKIEDIWYDKSLGLRSPQGLRYWIKVVLVEKTINTRMAEVLINRFGITEGIFTKICLDPASWLLNTIETERSKNT